MFGPIQNVVLVGILEEKDTQNMLWALWKPFLPNLVISLRGHSTTELGYEQLEGKTTAYVCRGQTCLLPTNSVTKMIELLEVG